MSIRQGNNIIAGARKKNCVLFEPQWFDYTISDINWVRADNFAWNDGYIYSAAYTHLVNDIDGFTPTDTVSETINDTTIYYYLAPDGHKIAGPDQESAVQSIYESTGIAWYYILDETNHRFKLPRTKFAFTGFRDSVGKYVAPGLPNITGRVTGDGFNGTAAVYWGNNGGALYNTYENTTANIAQYGASTTKTKMSVIGIDASRSNNIYGASTTVQNPSTQMYLYFYVGEFTQSALENLANINISALAEITNSIENLNAHRVINFQAPTAENNYTWYRKYADGWVEQGCLNCSLAAQEANSVAPARCSFPITMNDTIYHTTWIRTADGGNTYELTQINIFKSTTYVDVYFFSTVATAGASTVDISVCGMAA